MDVTTGFEEAIRDALDRMAEFHSGEHILAVAQSLLTRLPSGPLVLVSTSIEGAALAAVISAISPNRDLAWYLINPIRHHLLPEGRIVVVEPVDAGSGWRKSVESALPGAQFIIGSA